MMIEISVIIPTYGMPVLLKKAIESVLNQSFKDFELIIVDDNNPKSDAREATENLISSFDDGRIKYIKHPKNMNGAAARNTGIKAAQGRYIAFLDSDDEYMLTRLEKCYYALEQEDSKYGAVYTGCDFYKNGKLYKEFHNVKSGSFLVETLSCTFMFCTGSNIFMRANIVRELNGFDELFLRHQDYEFMVRFFEKYSILALKESLVIKNEECFNLPNVEKLIEIKEQYLNKFQKLIYSQSDSSKNYIVSSNYYQIAQAGIENKNNKVFQEYYSVCKKYGLDIKRRIKIALLRIKYRV